jgi:hypothetical protein
MEILMAKKRSFSLPGPVGFAKGLPGVVTEMEELISYKIKPFEPTYGSTLHEQSEESAREVLEWIRNEINGRFVGTRDDKQTRECMKAVVEQSLHQVEQARVLPPGVKIENARIEGDMFLADVVIPYPLEHVDFKVSFDVPKRITLRSNLKRPGAPWSYDE